MEEGVAGAVFEPDEPEALLGAVPLHGPGRRRTRSWLEPGVDTPRLKACKRLRIIILVESSPLRSAVPILAHAILALKGTTQSSPLVQVGSIID
jgi:hypothetical protein